MSKLSRNVLLLAKIQPVAGTDPVPTAAANAMLAGNLTFNAIEAAFADRDIIKPYFGNRGQVLISSHTTISFDVELQSAGAAGTAPKFGPLLRACAFAETISPGVSVAYAPVTNSQEFVTFWFYLDGILFKMTDSKGTVSLDVSAGGIPKMSFSFTGLFSQPTDVPVASGAVYTGFIDPLGVNKINTPTFSLHGAAFKAQTLSLDVANQVVYRNLIGSEAILITDRQPAGSVSIETESVATKDWYTIIRNGTLGALQVIHGTVAGFISQIDAPKVQVVSPSFSDSDGISMFNLNLILQPNAGNDELVLTFK
jgi:hypothetical protein